MVEHEQRPTSRVTTTAHSESRLALAATADLAMTSAPFTLSRGYQARTVARQMEESGFDVLPVDHATTTIWINRLLLLDGTRADLQDPPYPTKVAVQSGDCVPPATPLLDVLRGMAERRRAYVFVGQSSDVVGLITYADLNRHPMRAAVYALVAPLEAIIVAAIERVCPRDRWFSLLPENERSRVLAYWGQARARGIELPPIHYASFGQLSQIATGSSAIVASLRGLPFDVRKALCTVREVLRDPVAHVGKPLISHPADIPIACQACDWIPPLTEAFCRCGQ